MRYLLIAVIITLFYVLTINVKADVFEEIYPEEYSSDINKNHLGEEEQWQEGKIVMPPVPDNNNLIEISGSAAYPNYQYSIDEKSFRVDPDGVVRYIIVIKSPGGAQNTMYEGVRCVTGEYITYAFTNSSDNTFVEKIDPAWKPVSNSGAMGYTGGLIRNYFCNKFGELLDRQQIIQNMKYGKGTVDSTGYIE